MTFDQVLTAEQFADLKYDLPEGGRWSELVEGRILTLDPPDEGHGTTVLNLSKALALHFQRAGERAGYACFELGLIVARGPDTVRCPPISCFADGPRFAELDKVVTETRPRLIVELASTSDRRRDMPGRVDEYRAWGVELVWVADSRQREIQIFRHGQSAGRLEEDQMLGGAPVLPEFEICVGDLFAVPGWWAG